MRLLWACGCGCGCAAAEVVAEAAEAKAVGGTDRVRRRRGGCLRR